MKLHMSLFIIENYAWMSRVIMIRCFENIHVLWWQCIILCMWCDVNEGYDVVWQVKHAAAEKREPSTVSSSETLKQSLWIYGVSVDFLLLFLIQYP